MQLQASTISFLSLSIHHSAVRWMKKKQDFFLMLTKSQHQPKTGLQVKMLSFYTVQLWSNFITSPGWPPWNSRCSRRLVLSLGTLYSIWHIWSCSFNWPPWALGGFYGSALSRLDSLGDVERLVLFGELSWGFFFFFVSLGSLFTLRASNSLEQPHSGCQIQTLHKLVRISWGSLWTSLNTVQYVLLLFLSYLHSDTAH